MLVNPRSLVCLCVHALACVIIFLWVSRAVAPMSSNLRAHPTNGGREERRRKEEEEGRRARRGRRGRKGGGGEGGRAKTQTQTMAHSRPRYSSKPRQQAESGADAEKPQDSPEPRNQGKGQSGQHMEGQRGPATSQGEEHPRATHHGRRGGRKGHSEAPQARASILPMERHGERLQEHGGAGAFGRELA